MDKPSIQRTEHVNHSGNLPEEMVEKPVQTSNIPLAEDSLQKFASLDKDAEYPVEIDYLKGESTPQVETKKKSKVGRYIFVGTAAVAVAAGAVFGVKAMTPAPSSEPVATAPSDPTPEAVAETPVVTDNGEKILTVEALEIPSTLSPAEAGEKFISTAFSDKKMAGTTQDTYDKFYAANGSSAPLEIIAAQNSKIYNEALLIPGWESNESLVNYDKNTTGTNVSNLAAWALTKDSGFPQDKEPFNAWIEVDSVDVISSDEDSAQVKLDVTDYNNIDKNRVEDINPAFIEYNGSKSTVTLDIEQIDGTWKISNMATSTR